MSLLSHVDDKLSDSGFATKVVEGEPPHMLFESANLVGVVLEFESVAELVETWEARLNRIIGQHRFAFKRSGPKAWNSYAILITADVADDDLKPVLTAIEEDLTGTRKIVRSGCRSDHDLIVALLPLLPIQNSPEIPVIDFADEVQIRLPEMPDDVFRAFFTDASDGIVLQVLEES